MGIITGGVGTKVLEVKNTANGVATIETTYITVAYSVNTGDFISFIDKTVAVGGIYGSFPTVSKTGYVLNGWYTATTGGTKIEYNTEVVLSINHTLYAQWSPIQYSIVFNGNRSTSGSMSAMNNLLYDSSYALASNAFSRNNYIFTGWNTSQNGTGASFADEEVVSNLRDVNNSSITLYAQWTPSNPSDQWYYYGTSDPGDQGFGYIDYSEIFDNFCPALNVVESIANIERPYSNHAPGTVLRFVVYRSCVYGDPGCLCDFSGTGQPLNCRYYCNTSYFIAAKANIIATFDPNGGTWWDSTTVNKTKSVAPDYESFSSPGNVTKTGYQHIGWTPSLPTEISIATTFVANWSPIQYQVSFNSNGGYGSMTNQTFVYDISESINLNTFTRTNYTFVGWSLTPSGIVEYQDGEIVENLTTTNNDIIVFYAQWEPTNQATRWYYYGTSNPGTLPGGGQTLNYDTENYTCPSSTTIENYLNNNYSASNYPVEFKMTMNITANCNQGDPGCICELNGGTLICRQSCPTMYFIALGDDVTATFDPNGGVWGDLTNTQKTVDVAPTYETVQAPDTISRYGYVFLGWQPSTPTTISENTTFIAQWTGQAVFVTYNGNGATTGPSFTTDWEVFNEPYGALPTVDRTGYNLNGWFTAASGGSEILSTTPVYIAEDHILYAQWSLAVKEWVYITYYTSEPIGYDVIVTDPSVNISNAASILEANYPAAGRNIGDIGIVYNNAGGWFECEVQQ